MICLLVPAYKRISEATQECLDKCHFDKYLIIEGFADIAAVRHLLFKTALESECDEFLCVDSDIHGFDQETIETLRRHDLDIIAGDYLTKQTKTSVHGLSGDGLQESSRISLGFALIKRKMLEDMKEWFPRFYKDGLLLPEDVSFSVKAMQKGYSLYVDRNVMLDHGEVNG